MGTEVIIIIISVFGTGFAAVCLEFVKKYLSKAKEEADGDAGLRNELRVDIDSAKKEIEQLKKELKATELEADKWRADYWTLVQTYTQMRLLLDKSDSAHMTIEELRAKIPSQAPHEVRGTNEQ